MLMNSNSHSPNDIPSADWLLSRAPIDPRAEMAAYESLWMGPNAWFASIANLFRDHPGMLPSELVPALERDRVLQQLRDLLGDRMDEVGVRVHGSADYPDRLREADHPLEVFYYQGDWSLASSPGVAIVGTRNPTDEGAANAAKISRAMVREGFTVVSGLAKGIDRAAHMAAIEARGHTIAVIGTPLFDSYPKENAPLQRAIAEGHLLISQVPFLRYKNQHYKTNRLFFPARNVTMSALTRATIIVEAGETSGTLVQARAALNQGRQLFILESCFRRTDLTWPAKYEKQGAIRVKSVTDILSKLGKASDANPDESDQ
ncbi:DNA-processing protein DprA [Stenotrophomonas sp. MA5]|uniref:DNA-processing protein DprA n=1 Tax=Stenotrophomonas sp. MA5 TaxID=2508572 RepID=UPI0019D6E3A2|nr:DNA-processing protein DprA [Stenotrophomonas sp. MA5]